MLSCNDLNTLFAIIFGEKLMSQWCVIKCQRHRCHDWNSWESSLQGLWQSHCVFVLCPFDSGCDASVPSPQDALNLNKPRFCSRPANKEASVGATQPQTAIRSASDSSTVLERVGGAEFSFQSCDITSMTVKRREACQGSLCVPMHIVSWTIMQFCASGKLIDAHLQESSRTKGLFQRIGTLSLAIQRMTLEDQKIDPREPLYVPKNLADGPIEQENGLRVPEDGTLSWNR